MAIADRRPDLQYSVMSSSLATDGIMLSREEIDVYSMLMAPGSGCCGAEAENSAPERTSMRWWGGMVGELGIVWVGDGRWETEDGVRLGGSLWRWR